MKSFVFIFRRGKWLLTPEEQSQRAAEVRTWALAQINADRKFDPRLLGAECCLIAPVNENAPALDGESAAMAITLGTIYLTTRLFSFDSSVMFGL